MVRVKVTSLILFCNFLSSVVPFQFQDAGQNGVTFGQKTSSAQLISIDESNNGGRVKIVLITEVTGNLTINVNSYDKSLIGIQQDPGSDSSQAYLSGNLLDYDMLISQHFATNYPVDVIENDDMSTKQTLSINIINIDDESPTLWTSACTMKEDTVITVDNSDCIFTISDPDGRLSTMDFASISGDNDEADLFEFMYRDVPKDDVYKADVVLVLKAGHTLDYESKAFYTFKIAPKDANNHQTSPLSNVDVIVQVEDMPDQPPKWNSDFRSVVTVVENEATTIQISATDGDLGINNEINYEITESSHTAVSIDKSTGLITVDGIDRDVDDSSNDQVVFTVRAYEVADPTYYIEETITLIVQDLDDNAPLITVEDSDEHKIDITVNENTIDFNLKIYANDIDTGENAIYNVTLKFTGGVDYSSGLTLTPENGYGSTHLFLVVIDPSKLDYEDPDWRVITMELQTIGIKSPDNTDSIPITITLQDVNDEVPQFDQTEYSVTVPENVTAGTSIAKILATDKDEEDITAGLKHELVGASANSILTIEALGGDVTISVDNAFDYEKQPEVIVEILATDSVGHQSTAQLTINVEDVNDEDPKIVAPSTISVSENQADGNVLSADITASDGDSNADLEFSIDWDKSYATKNSVKLSETDTIQCLKVKTDLDVPNQRVIANLILKETMADNTPDYELFDTLYIQLVVTDLNTVQGAGTDSVLIIISIDDINDNAPAFPDDSGMLKGLVTENAAAGTIIASVIATDVDTGDILIYSMINADDNTPADWAEIDSSTGLITLVTDQVDCDNPKRDSLTYNVTASDGTHSTTAVITVDIVDTNDNAPTMTCEQCSYKIPENADGDTTAKGQTIADLKPTDNDRDEKFATVKCEFASSTGLDVTSRFLINKDNQIVVALASGVSLDRETQEQFTFDLNCYDNPDDTATISNPVNPPPKVTITLEDINDNAPSIINTQIKANENMGKGTKIFLNGEDKDAEGTPNAKVKFIDISKITRYTDKDHSDPQDITPQDLFSLETDDKINNRGVLIVTPDNLANYYGELVLTINLSDEGDPPQTNTVDVTLEVAMYNFQEPTFVFPEEGETYYLAATQEANSALLQFDEEPFENIKATDQQSGKFALNLEIVDDSSGSEKLFTVVSVEDSVGQLRMTKDTFEKKTYSLTIRASVKNDDDSIEGSAKFSKDVTFYIDFFDKQTPSDDNKERGD